jgi:RNA 2',3'-cyclic 3'-phosphodiesterase
MGCSAPDFENSRPRHNIFFALYPPPEPAERIGRLTDRLFETGALSGRRVGRPRLHVSLNSLGEHSVLPERLIAHACAAVSQLTVPSFVLALNRVMSFETNKGLRPRVLTGDDGLIGVFMLHHAIHEALAKAGLMRGREPPILPHLTLSREEGLWPDNFIDPIVWRVRDFRLVHSRHGEGRHNILGRWPLLDDDSGVTWAEAHTDAHSAGSMLSNSCSQASGSPWCRAPSRNSEI